MRPTLIWLFRILGVAGVVTTVVLLFYIYFAPGIAERRILAALRGMGVDEASVQVRSVGAKHLQITNLNMSDGAGLTIGAVGVDYSVSPLGGLHVKTIEIIGAQLDLRMRDGKLDLGPLADIDTGDGESFADDGLPFDVLKLRAASVMFEWRGRRFALPVEATLTHKGKGECDVDARLSVLGVEVPVTGTVDFTASHPARYSPKASPAGRKAEGIEFHLTTPALGQPLAFIGWVGSGEDGEVSLGVSLPSGSDSDATAMTASAAFLTERDATKIIIKASGKPKRTNLAIAGYALESEDADLFCGIGINLTEGTIEGHLSLAAGSLSLRGGGRTLTLTGPSIKSGMTGSWTSDALTLEFDRDTALAFAKVSGTSGAEPVQVEGASVTLESAQLVLPLSTDSDVLPELQAALGTTPIDVQVGSSHFTLDRFEAHIDLMRDRDRRTVVTGGVTIANAAYENTDDAIRFAGVTASIPFTLGTPRTADPATFEIKEIRRKEDTFAAMKGAVSIDDGVLKANLDWPLFDEAPAKVTANIDLLHGFAGRVTAQVKDLRITDDQVVAKKLKAAEPFRVTGTFGLDADIAFGPGGIIPRIIFTAGDASFTAGKLDFVANGINTTLTLDSFAPLTTLPNQRLAIREGHLGKLNYRNAIINFRLDAMDAMVVELAAWSVGERGRFWMHAARFNPAAPVLETQVFIEDMSVAEWLQIIQDGEVAGEGWLYGRIPVRIDQAGEFVLTFGEGFLYAKPGKGWVRISRRAQTQQQVYKSLEEAIADLAREAQSRLLDAVMDFEFDTLKFDFIREDKGVLCRVSTSGRGRTGFKQEVGGLTVNIHNFGALLSRQLLRSADSIGAIDDTIKRYFEDK